MPPHTATNTKPAATITDGVKRGRPKLPEAFSRTTSIRFRVTPGEAATIQANAENRRRSLSAYVREGSIRGWLPRTDVIPNVNALTLEVQDLAAYLEALPQDAQVDAHLSSILNLLDDIAEKL